MDLVTKDLKKILIDSSVWVSYFLNKLRYKKVTQITEKIERAFNESTTILIPELVYCEVRNTLYQLGIREEDLKRMRYFLKRKKCKMYRGNGYFWFNRVDFYRQRVKLGTQDLIILAHAFENNVDDLITGDKKLLQAYNSLRP